MISMAVKRILRSVIDGIQSYSIIRCPSSLPYALYVVCLFV